MSVEIEKDGHVWTVIHNRPEARNAVDPQAAEELVAAFLEFEKHISMFSNGNGAIVTVLA